MTLQTKECHEAGENLLVQGKSNPASAPSCYYAMDFSLQKLHFFLSIDVFIQIFF